MLDERYPQAIKVRPILDNLNTHATASLDETFPASEARRPAERLEFHYTPKHGSWFNVAEIELGALASQCLLAESPASKSSLKKSTPGRLIAITVPPPSTGGSPLA
jgi:hypothetical protein